VPQELGALWTVFACSAFMVMGVGIAMTKTAFLRSAAQPADLFLSTCYGKEGFCRCISRMAFYGVVLFHSGFRE